MKGIDPRRNIDFDVNALHEELNDVSLNDLVQARVDKELPRKVQLLEDAFCESVTIVTDENEGAKLDPDAGVILLDKGDRLRVGDIDRPLVSIAGPIALYGSKFDGHTIYYQRRGMSLHVWLIMLWSNETNKLIRVGGTKNSSVG